MKGGNMSSIQQAINQTCAIMRPIFTTIDISLDIAQMITDENISKLKTAAIVSRTAVLVLNIFSLVGEKKGLSNHTLKTIKGIELGARMVDAPIQFSKHIKDLKEEEYTVSAIIRLVTRGAINPCTGILRNICELSIYNEKIYLEKLAKTSEAMRPHWEYDSAEHPNLIGYKKIDRQECERNIQLFEKISAGFNVAEASVYSIEASYYLIIQKFLEEALRQAATWGGQGGQQVIQYINQLPGNDAAQLPENIVDADNLFNFKKLSLIPVEFHQDPTLSKYSCPLTLSPIRNIVQDPTAQGEEPIFYERDAIALWLASNQTSPMTRRPLTLEQLFPRFDLQELIDARLEFFENAVKDFLREKINESLAH